MTKDYAKKRPKKYSQAKTASRISAITLPSWAWMLFGLLFGGIISGALFWKLTLKMSLDEVAEPTITVISSSNESDNTPAINVEPLREAPVATEEEPRFDFYNLLPNLTVDVPDVAAPKQVDVAQKPTPKESASPEAFIIQVGSFRHESQADELKVKLILQGQDAHIQTVKINSTDIWYRVYIGPFAAKKDALATQQNLTSSDTANSLILKIRV